MDYNYNHVVIFYLPGAAGNFLGRCLNLLKNTHCFVDRETQTIPTTLDEKVQLLSYEEIENRESVADNWVTFENKVVQFCQVANLYKQIPHKEYIVQIKHPSSNRHYRSRLLSSDRNFLIYIDPTDAYEWHALNCLYKNSLLGAHWFLGATEIIKDPEVFKVSLKNIITDVNSFWDEFSKICKYIEHPVNSNEEQAIRQLYSQWIKTTLPESKFSEFKELLGLNKLIP